MNRKEEIIQIAAKLFHEKGYHRTTLDDIAAELGFSKPAIYYYFASKEEILYEICLSAVSHLLAYTHQVQSSSLPVLEKIISIICKHIETFSDNRDVAGVYLSEESELPLEKRLRLRSLSREYEIILRSLLQQAIDEGFLRPVETKMIVKAISGMCNWVSYWYNPSGPTPIQEIAATFVDFMLRGLSR